jgi:hypothetical protein
MKSVSHLSKSIIVACGGSPTKEGDNHKSTPEEIGAVIASRWVKAFNDNGVIEFINYQITSSCRISSALYCSWNIQSPKCCKHDDWYTTVGVCLRD